MKKEKTPAIVSLAILTLITSIVWIFFSLYRVFSKKTDVKVPENIVEPFSPELNEKIISEIENKVFIDQNQLPDIKVVIENTTNNQETEQKNLNIEIQENAETNETTNSAEITETAI
jgi:hypothetical protein